MQHARCSCFNMTTRGSLYAEQLQLRRTEESLAGCLLSLNFDMQNRADHSSEKQSKEQ